MAYWDRISSWIKERLSLRCCCTLCRCFSEWQTKQTPSLQWESSCPHPLSRGITKRIGVNFPLLLILAEISITVSIFLCLCSFLLLLYFLLLRVYFFLHYRHEAFFLSLIHFTAFPSVSFHLSGCPFSCSETRVYKVVTEQEGITERWKTVILPKKTWLLCQRRYDFFKVTWLLSSRGTVSIKGKK